MKTRILLVVSVLVNAGLLAGYFVSTRPAASPAAAAHSEPATKVVKQKVVETRPSRAVTNLVDKDFNWASVESADYKQYIANLRAIGTPEETIRDIIIADVSKLYASKIAALRPSPADFKFWKTNDREARNAERERRRKERDLQEVKGELIQELLGVALDAELPRQNGEPNRDDYRYGWLPQDKQEAVKALREKFRDQERAIFTDGKGMTPENRAKLLALRAQQEAEMTKLLTPAEYAEYQLRNSTTARSMRENLTAFQPTEQEFREIFKLQQTFDDQFGMSRGGDDAYREQRHQAEQALEEQLKALLGDQRFKEYTMAQDDRYRGIYDFAQNNNLPTDTAQKIYDTRVAAENERQRIRNDQSLSEDQRQVLLVALSSQTKQALGTMLGQDVYKAYQQNDGGRWIHKLDNPGDGRSGGSKNQRSGRG